MKKIILILLVILNLQVFSEECNLGFELDVLPFATGGYYGSVWKGLGNFRIRYINTEVNIPDFMLKDGFKDSKSNANAFILDYFFNENYEGLWFGIGYEYWENSIKNEDNSIKKDYNQNIFTFGTGYVFNLSNNFYLNPWIAGHYNSKGEDSIDVGGKEFKIDEILYSASLKIGFKF